MSPTDRAGIAGIGSLWHMGLKFANAWDCEVKAFTSSESRAEEAKRLGAHHVIFCNMIDAGAGLLGLNISLKGRYSYFWEKVNIGTKRAILRIV